jgi:hypothetical protein
LKAFASVLIAIACLLAAPSAALAVTYTVDSTLDEPDVTPGVGGCLTAGVKCTLRAAIEESNFSALVLDEIAFAAAFNGQLADTITLGSLLPAITKQVSVKGGLCTTQAGQQGPCAGVDAPSLNYALTVEDTDGVVIEGLAVTGAVTGIRVVNSSQGFIGRNDWLGVKLDGSNGTGANTGIWLDPDSNGATIGGAGAGERNVFANNAAEGLDIEGADNADVLGNYFGVKADGVTQAANGKSIEITDTAAFEATGNEVGATMEGAELAAPCDNGCNVISGATSAGIDLHGNGGNEEPATGPTTIHGNYVGLSAIGTAVVANATYGVLSGASNETMIGGPENGDANFIAGGGTGIYHENGEGFEAAGNVIGSGPTGADLTSPGLGMFVFCLNNTEPVAVDGNVIEMDGGTGIEERFGAVAITQNFIEGAQHGILTFGDPPLVGNLIAGNVIGDSVLSGIQIENDFNEVLGNAIYGSGAAGIRIQNPGALLVSTGNLIGGDTPGEENTIRESGGDAIEIVDSFDASEGSANEVARNHGDLNGGLFIDLVEDANDGILPPTFSTSTQSGASGSGAEAGATIRVFRKGEVAPGEIESFLAEAIADGGGNWKVAYPAPIPAGTMVAATQTSAAVGTSELALATTTADPTGGGGSGGGAGGDTTDKDTKDKDKKGKAKGKSGKAPETTIVKGPKARSRKRTAKFKFVSSEPNSTFQCKLDKKPFRKCKSPKKYKRLKPGRHVFKVRAIDADGNVDKTPAKRKFRVIAAK